MNSVITLPASEEVNVSSIQISTLHNFCSPYFFSASKPKGGSNIKTFIENRFYLTFIEYHFELRYARFQRSLDNVHSERPRILMASEKLEILI